MAENPYLKSINVQYKSLQDSIKGLQQRAKDANRDLTNEELRSVIEQGEKAKALYTQIEDLSEIELRNAKVAAMNERVTAAVTAGATAESQPDEPADGDGPADSGQFRTLGGAKTQDRDPGFYTRGSRHSFVGDQYRAARLGDDGAKERLTKHSNALRDNEHLRDVLGAGASTFGAGLVPPVWLAEQFAPILHRKLRVASVLRQVPWAGPFPWTIPIAGTVALTSSIAEGVNATETDPGYSTITVTPATIMGYSEVSRQMLEASNPAVDSIIWGDLTGDFLDRCETMVITALEAQSGVNLATVLNNTLATDMRGGVLDAIAAVSDNSGGDADVFVSKNSKWVGYLKLTDTTNRPLVEAQRYAPTNIIGVSEPGQQFSSPVQGNLESLMVVTSPTVGTMRGFVINSQELLYQNSPPMQFSFEQPAGPALIRIGIWGYAAVTTARRPKAITKIVYSNN
jgi:HK97 family phage major capsid protein